MDKALVLFSGGLDSLLATCKIIEEDMKQIFSPSRQWIDNRSNMY